MSTPSNPTWLTEPATFVKTEFDYLVVGGGTAGLALASRLAEDAKYKVGVIDAGRYLPDEPLINIPANWGRLLADKSFTWKFMTTPQEHAENRSVYLPSGKVLGGSSAINLMAFMRAGKIDYDNWEALGNPGWGWDCLLPYFKRSENYFSPNSEAKFPGGTRAEESKAKELEHVYRGMNGPLPITYNKTYHPLYHPSVKTLNEMGIATNHTPEGGNATGVYNVPRTVDQVKQVRASSVMTYLAGAGRQGNILVVTEAQATKVVFSEDASTGLYATGVQFVSNEQTFHAHAKKEVILSTGAFQTPQLLELSGIGDAKRLAGLDIPCLIDLPQVGENYQDHLAVVNTFEITSPPDDSGAPNVPNNSSHTAVLFKAPEMDDPTFTISTFTFFPLQQIIPHTEFSAMLKRLDEAFEAADTTPLQKAQFKLQRKSLTDPQAGSGEILFAPSPAGKNFFSMVAATQYPYSRGHVHIQSKDPLTKPIVDPHFCQFNFDVEVMSKISQFCLKIIGTDPIKPLIAGRVIPPPTVQDDKAYEAFSREKFQTIYHAAGTAAMAPRELGGVVDPSLRVYGTRNLRVADASIMPLHIAAHPQATIYAIAEKAADLIKADR